MITIFHHLSSLKREIRGTPELSLYLDKYGRKITIRCSWRFNYLSTYEKIITINELFHNGKEQEFNSKLISEFNDFYYKKIYIKGR